MKLVFKALSVCLLPLFISCASAPKEESSLETVSNVDLKRYIGDWYEVARYPNKFQEDCEQSTAHYQLREDGLIGVENRCINVADDKVESVQGVARVVDSNTNAKLEVNFLPSAVRWTGIGDGDYWIIDLADDYSYSVVSEPEREQLWILAREPKLDPEVYKEILKDLEARGFETEDLIQR